MTLIKSQIPKLVLNPQPKQFQAYQQLNNPEKRFIVFGGGAGGGKSWLGAEWLIGLCLQFVGIKVFIGREELSRLMKSSFITILNVIKFHNIPNNIFVLNSKYNYLECAITGSRIDLLDLAYKPSDPLYERFGSLEYTSGWIEEAGEINFHAFDVLKSRINRCKNQELNIPPKILITCNPKKNWLYQQVYKPWRENCLSEKYAFIQSLYGDNRYTSDSYGQSLSQITDAATRQRLMYGNWEYEEGSDQLFKYDAIIDLWGNFIEKSDKKFITVDPARLGQDRTIIGVWKGFDLFKIIKLEKATLDKTQATIEEIRNFEMIPKSQVICDEDGVGGGLVDFGGYKGFTNNSTCIQPEEAMWDENKKLNYSNLKTQCYFMLAEKINNNLIRISEESHRQEIIDDLEQIKIKDPEREGKVKIMSKEEIKEVYGKSPDYADCMMMRMYFELKKPAEKKPLPLPDTKSIYNIPKFT